MSHSDQPTVVIGPIHRLESVNGITVVVRPDGTHETYEGPVTVQADTITGGIHFTR
ncbi:hypothetical protein HNR12_002195 [Streptomonospora nanhaiensis]|uniref:Uncharacterized protein n=1 Tax=Streptomonospora nanhaiensis TaxID=1323731 RepID=A0A853BK87_9ACTN|nr:hypothetical protein [Streptomonospora nanhaiensis]NYI95918.1 hypothetical protein [Streptomonospora nanhaiensis]